MFTQRRLALGLAAAVLIGACSPPPPDQAMPSDTPVSEQTRADPPKTRSQSGRATGAPEPKGAATTPPEPAAPVLDPAAVPQVRTPRELAAILVAAETAIRDDGVRGAALADAAHTQQRVYRRLALEPKLRRPVLRAVPAHLRPYIRHNVLAGASLAELSSPQRRLPDWRIMRPEPAPRLLRHYRRAAARFGLEWEYLAAINLVETRMGRIRGRSTAGAQGPMQFMPATWDAYGRGDVNDAGDAIEAAARYLAASGGPEDMRKALWHYNHSDRYVDAVSAYAEVMQADPRTFRGYYHWQVYYATVRGDVHLPEGYGD